MTRGARGERGVHRGATTPWTAVLGGAFLGGLLWLPALALPYWQDDYDNLFAAREAIARGDSWWASFAPVPGTIFWRPLSAALYWRSLTAFFHADAFAAHLGNLLFLVLSAFAITWLASSAVARWTGTGVSRAAALAGGFLVAIHGSRLIPAAWASCIQESMGVAFASLALLCWIRSTQAEEGTGRMVASWLLPLFVSAALLSKESAIVIPGLAAIFSWWLWPRGLSARRTAVLGAVIVGLSAAWLLLRQALLAPPASGSAYALHAGWNVPRNALSLLLFALDLPRESLRYTIERHSLAAAAWGASCLVLQVTAILLLLPFARRKLGRRGLLAAGAIFVAGCAPYIPLNWNCYDYYVSLGLIAYAALVSSGDPREKRFRYAVALSLAASLLAGVRWMLPPPSLVGRGRQAEHDLRTIEEEFEAPSVAAGPGVVIEPRLIVEVRDPERYRVMGGRTGIAFRLGLGRDEIRLAEPGTDSTGAAASLRIDEDGVRVAQPGGS